MMREMNFPRDKSKSPYRTHACLCLQRNCNNQTLSNYIYDDLFIYPASKSPVYPFWKSQTFAFLILSSSLMPSKDVVIESARARAIIRSIIPAKDSSHTVFYSRTNCFLYPPVVTWRRNLSEDDTCAPSTNSFELLALRLDQLRAHVCTYLCDERSVWYPSQLLQAHWREW